ncbi:MAG: hypothetical protein Q9162_001351 [Coniocarpon cinnabarinum]
MTYYPSLLARKFNEIATPKLYKELVLDIGTEDDSAITQLLSPQNPGLNHVRKLVLKSKTRDDEFQNSQIQFVVGSLLQGLPRDCLEYFRWRPWKALSFKNVELLYKNQRKMLEMELLPVPKPEAPQDSLPHPSIDALQHARELNLFIGTVHALEQANYFVKHGSETLDILMVQCFFTEKDFESERPEDPLQDTPEHSGQTLRTIFRHKLAGNDKEPIKARTLHLQEVPVHQAPTWFRVVDSTFLTKLILLKCDGAAKALGELCRLGTGNLRLKHLDITHCENTEGGDVRGTVETILNVVSGLETLEVELCCCSSLIQPSSVCRQSSSLKRLELFCTKEHGKEGRYDGCLHYKPSDMGMLASHMERVEEMLLPYVECDISYSLEDDKLGEMFDAFTGPQCVLKNLRTLQWFTFPGREDTDKKLSSRLFDHLLAAHAEKLFNASGDEGRRMPKLWFIAWGGRRSDEPEKHATIFLKGTRAPMLGMPHLAAVPVTLDWFDKHYEPSNLTTMDLAR